LIEYKEKRKFSGSSGNFRFFSYNNKFIKEITKAMFISSLFNNLFRFAYILQPKKIII